VIAVVLIAPAAFFMGMTFPTGLDALGGKVGGLLPWAWGMNGALSVTGAVVARLLSVSFGFVHVLVGIIYPANEAGGAGK
jgi:hypothetical protein